MSDNNQNPEDNLNIAEIFMRIIAKGKAQGSIFPSRFNDIFKEKLAKKMNSLAPGCNEQPETVEPEVGDRVEFLNPLTCANYLTHTEDNSMINGGEPIPMDLLAYLDGGSAILGEILKEAKPFMCGHCSNTHYHDCIIHYPAIKKSFYADYDGLVVAKSHS